MGVYLALFCKDCRFVPALCINFTLQGFLTVLQMLFISSGGIDLLFQDVDFPFQLSPQHAGVVQLGTGLFNALIQFFDFRLDLIVFLFNMFIFLCGFLQIPGGYFVFFTNSGQLLTQTVIFQEKHIDIQILQIFFFLQVDLCFFRLLFQRLHLLFQL